VINLIEFEGISFRWLGHDGFLIEWEGKTICIDPFQVEGSFEAVDVLISSHHHMDHCSEDDLMKFASSNTDVIGIPLAKDTLEKLDCKTVHYVQPGDKKIFDTITVEMVHAYNVNKFREPGKPFHPKEEKHIGVVIELGNVRLYHTGDSDHIPEMANINADVALLPVSGTYVMTAAEAIEAAKTLNPKLAIPMHFGNIVGDRTMAEEFEKGVSCTVKIPTLD
jgi:L-ascorbate metabolism protein UlaG (beta-lactamase superfamily)